MKACRSLSSICRNIPTFAKHLVVNVTIAGTVTIEAPAQRAGAS